MYLNTMSGVNAQTSNDPSLNSSYADVFEASGVVIRDYDGSYSKGPLVWNDVTYNLNKCKSNVVVPYFKLLCLIAWRRFECCTHWCIKLLNWFYTLLIFSILVFWYIIRALTCNGRLMVKYPNNHPPTPSPINASSIINMTMMTNATHFPTPHENFTFFPNTCNHIFGTYIVPNFLHFSAFLIGFYHFRIKEHEGLYVLMEKVYLQSRYPGKMTRTLRNFMIGGFLWLVFCLGTIIHYFFAFNVVHSTGIPRSRPYLMYSMAILITVSNLFAKCVNLAVVLSYCGQCELLKYYIDGIAERLEEKSTQLKTAMKELLDIQIHFKRLNGSLSYSMSLLTFDTSIVFLLNIILLFNYQNLTLNVWLYRLLTAITDTIFLVFVLVQAAHVTARPKKIMEKALTCRVFGYQTHTENDIDSFLNFVNKIELQAELFTIPMKSQYLWGSMFIGIQVFILAVQTGGLIDRNSMWL